jgi:hypothetical protein
MKLYIDESIHPDHDFMLLAYVMCEMDPQTELEGILSKHGATEFHACARMKDNSIMQGLRDAFCKFVNDKGYWGVIVLPISSRYSVAADIHSMLEAMVNIHRSAIELFIDEGIVSKAELQTLSSLKGIVSVCSCSSHEIKGIQLADLVAALNGVRLREEISGDPKMLVYGKEFGYDPPIDAELGYELWARLRYSMMREPLPRGEDMPMFTTHGHGLFISPRCSSELADKAEKVFGTVYLGCIH